MSGKPRKRNAIAEIIRQKRLDRGFSQRELARLANVDSGDISRIESGDRPNPRIETLWKIAPHLGLDPTELVRQARGLSDNPGTAQQADEAALLRRMNRKQRDTSIGKVFGERLRLLRAEECLERDALARELGITYAALTRYELGGLPEVPVLCRIAERFNVSLDYLVGRASVRQVATDQLAASKLVVYAADLEPPADDSPESWSRYLNELASLSKRTSKRDRSVILNIARELSAKHS